MIDNTNKNNNTDKLKKYTTHLEYHRLIQELSLNFWAQLLDAIDKSKWLYWEEKIQKIFLHIDDALQKNTQEWDMHTKDRIASGYWHAIRIIIWILEIYIKKTKEKLSHQESRKNIKPLIYKLSTISITSLGTLGFELKIKKTNDDNNWNISNKNEKIFRIPYQEENFIIENGHLRMTDEMESLYLSLPKGKCPALNIKFWDSDLFTTLIDAIIVSYQ